MTPKKNPTMLEMLKKAENEHRITFKTDMMSKKNARFKSKSNSVVTEDDLGFSGSFKDVFDEVMYALRSKPTIDNYLELYLQSPRLLRGFIDYDIESNNYYQSSEPNFKHLYIKRNLTKAVADIFRGRLEKARTRLEDLIVPLNEARAFGYDFGETCVDYHWQANSPHRAEIMIATIQSLEQKPDCMVMVGHSSYRQGFILHEATKIPVFPIRYSSSKTDTMNLHLPISSSEGTYLRGAFNGKNILIFDEFMFGGDTLRGMSAAMRSSFPEIKSLKLACAHANDLEYACSIWDYDPDF